MNKKEFLIDRMEIENVNKLLEFNQEYPNSGQLVMDELCEKEFWTGLTYETICRLSDVLGCGYTPSDISKLFK